MAKMAKSTHNQPYGQLAIADENPDFQLAIANENPDFQLAIANETGIYKSILKLNLRWRLKQITDVLFLLLQLSYSICIYKNRSFTQLLEKKHWKRQSKLSSHFYVFMASCYQGLQHIPNSNDIPTI